ncbi:hypothetical protein FRC12_020223 [Ceratobasidium sp. 428]|nr:hypothetical protein FRC12_020223 [Ceratobasidium sp. 428]
MKGAASIRLPDPADRRAGEKQNRRAELAAAQRALDAARLPEVEEEAAAAARRNMLRRRKSTYF